MRHWREYQRSLERLYTMEDEQRGPNAPVPERMPPWLEWWEENFALVRDILVRRHAIHVQSYDGLLADPAGVVGKVLAWLGEPDLDVAAAIAAVHPGNRTQHRPEVEGVPPAVAETFDALYQSIHEHQGLHRSLMERLSATNRELAPLVHEHRRRLMAKRPRRGPGAAPVAP
jgi:hypothetical protein